MAFIAEITRKSQCVEVDKSLFDRLLNRLEQKNDIAEIRKQEEILRQCTDRNSPVYKEAAKRKAIIKSQLPGFIFQCVDMESWHKIDSKKTDWGEGKWRSQEHAVLNGLTMIDIDHVDNPRQLWAEKVLPWIKAHPGMVQLVYVTPSGHGLKVVFTASLEHGNLMSNQLWFAKELGIEVDDSCKDASRLSFASTADDVLFLGPRLFSYYDEEYSRRYTPEYNKGLSQPDLFKEKTDPIPKKEEKPLPENSAQNEAPEDFTYMDLKPYEIMGKMLEGQDVGQGKRHTVLLSLVADARYFCDRDVNVIRQNLRHFDWFRELEKENPSEVDRTINDAMAYQMKPYLPKNVKEVLKGIKQNDGEKEDLERKQAIKFEEYGQQFAEMFKTFPCMRAVCRDMPTASYPAMIFSSAAMFGTLMTRCHYFFYDKPQVPRRFNYGIMIIADPASRKSMVEYLNDLIMQPVKLSDDLGNDAINEYKKERTARSTSTKEQKKEALQKPDVIIRIHGTRTANGVFIEDMVNCKEVVNGELMHLHLYTFDSELDSAKIASSGGQWIDKSIFELKAFHNETDNQQYKNVESVSGPFKVYWNYVYTGTPLSLGRKVNERNFGSGLFSRLAVIPLCSDIFEMMPFGKVDKKLTQFDNEISGWANILDKASGELPIGALVKETYNWTRERMLMAEIEKNKKDAQLCKRVAWYGINIAAPFVFMRHFKEWEEKRSFEIDKEDLALCRLVMDVQFYSQDIYFGKMAEMYFADKANNANAARTSNHYEATRSYWDALPATFAIEDLEKISGLIRKSCHTIVYRWKSQGYIEEKRVNSKKAFRKIKSLSE